MTSLLEIDRLTVSFKGRLRTVKAVRDLSLFIEAGEVLALVGESGSGKSVTASTIVGLLPRSAPIEVSGSIRLDGQELLGLGEKELNRVRGRRIGTVFQNPASSLDPSFTVGRQLLEVVRHHRKLTIADARVVVADWLQRVGIRDVGRVVSAYPHELSGGMKQRVMVAIACIPSPSLLIADEPTTALDPTIQRQVLDLLGRLRDELGMALLIVTHDFGVVSYLADRVAVLRQGRLVESGAVDTVLVAPTHIYTRQLIDAVPVLHAHSADNKQGSRAAVPRLDAIEGQGDEVIRVEGLSKRFRVRGHALRWTEFTAIQDVSLAIRRGKSLGLIGESGSGKSTLARLMAGLLRPSEGTVTFEGRNIAELGAKEKLVLHRSLQMVFQDHGSALNPRLRIGTQLTRPMVQLGVVRDRDSEATDRAAVTLERVGLDSSYLKRYPHQLSGGQRQRVGIARALGVGPRVVILDEPTSALDVSTQAQILDLLRELKASLDLTFVLIAHNLAVVELFSDQVVVLEQGRLVDTFAAENFLAADRHVVTRSLVDAVLPLRATLAVASSAD